MRQDELAVVRRNSPGPTLTSLYFLYFFGAPSWPQHRNFPKPPPKCNTVSWGDAADPPPLSLLSALRY